jgi:NADPH-dependent 2,4-dienoyl-CoA reductase/sulfur reductase-like enzyme
MKVIIVGGAAGGASCAARLRRLNEKAEILMVERGPYVSYANCGLPYHIGGVIEKESSLLVATEQTFRTQFAIDCRRDAASTGGWTGLDAVRRNRIDPSRHHDLEAVPFVRSVGHRHPARHKAVFRRPDHGHGWFSGAFDGAGVGTGPA